MALPSRAARGEHAGSTHNKQSTGEALQPWEGSSHIPEHLAHFTCVQQNPAISISLLAAGSAGAALARAAPGTDCRLAPREGVTSWDRAVGNSKCKCWSLLW